MAPVAAAADAPAAEGMIEAGGRTREPPGIFVCDCCARTLCCVRVSENPAGGHS